MKKAARYGSAEAQQEMGRRYDTGDGLPADPAQAVRLFRLCATGGLADCQFRLAQLLLADPHQPEAVEQAVAWLQVAAEQGNAEAGKLASAEIDKLTNAQIITVKRLEVRFARKPTTPF